MTRALVLDNIRRHLGADAGRAARAEEVQSRLARHPANTVPARARREQPALVATFTEMLERVHGSVGHASDLAAVPAAVGEYLGGRGRICLSLEVRRIGLPWDAQPGLDLVAWRPRASFDVCVTACVGAAAETGTVAVRSSALSPLTQHFLADKHIVILESRRLMGAYEDLWILVRDEMPRHMTFVSGPSCTGDIEMIMEYGAHGPRNLHVIIVDSVGPGVVGAPE